MDSGDIRSRLTLDFSAFKRGLEAATGHVRQLGTDLRNALGPRPRDDINDTRRSVDVLGGSFKDLGRIVSGILISQMFYGAIQGAQNAISAVTHFTNEMEKAQIAMEYFLGTPEAAKGFILNMKDFAATTAFSTEQALVLSRKLMNAQFKPENIRGVMSILNDASVVGGGTPEMMDRIVLALTQIKTQGKLAGQEMRQLAEAQIPIYQILKDELGLTEDQLKNIGQMKISADVAISAILNGLKKYEGAAERIANTVPGMFETIKDNALMLGESVFARPYAALKDFMTKVRDTVETMRYEMTETGLGGVFEKFIPPQLHEAIRNIIGSFRSLWTSIKMVADAINPIMIQLFGQITVALGQALPVIALVARTIAQVTKSIIESNPWIQVLIGSILGILIANTAAKALMFLWSVMRLGFIASAVGQAVIYLGRAIQFLTIAMAKNGVARIVMVIATALTYLALSSQAATGWLSKMEAKLAGIAGFDTSKILQPEDGKSTEEWIKNYNKQLEDSAAGFKDVGKEADKAGKKVKNMFTASFDELYQIPDELDKAGSGLDDLSDLLAGGGLNLGPGFSLEDILGSGGLGGLKDKDFDLPPIVGNAKPPTGGGNSGPPIDPPNMAPVTEAVTTMNKLLEGLKANVTNVGVAIADGLTNIGGVVVRGLQPLQNFVKDFKTTLDGLLGGLNTGAVAVGNFANNIATALSPLGVIVTAIDAVKTALDGMSTAWNETLSVMVGVLTGSTLLAVWSSIWENMKLNFQTAMQNLFTGLQGNITNVSTAITNGATAWATSIGTFFTNMATTFTTSVDKWKVTLTTFFTNMGTSISTALTQWYQGFTGMFTNIATATTEHVEKWKTSFVNFFTGMGTVFSENVEMLTTTVSTFVTNLGTTFVENFTKWKEGWGTFFTGVGTVFSENVTKWKEGWSTFFSGIGTIASDGWKQISAHWDKFKENLFGPWKTFLEDFKGKTWKDFWNGLAIPGKKVLTEELPQWWEENKSAVLTILGMMIPGIGAIMPKIGNALKLGFGGFMDDIALKWGKWLDDLVLGISNMVGKATKALGSFIDDMTGGLAGKVGNAVSNITGGKVSLPGYATGSIIDQEQIARVGEGGKREAIIPMENSSYMKPFSSAVANDLLQMLGGSGGGGGSQQRDERPILYVGTLIADDRSMKELYRKMEVIGVSENQRKGLSNG